MAKTISRKAMTQTVDGKVTREAKEDKTNSRGRFFWWKHGMDGPEESMAGEISSTIKFMEDHQNGRINRLTMSTRLYGHNAAFNLIGASFSRASGGNTSPNNLRIGFNLCASIIDTITAQVAKNKVVPTFITSGGVWGMQRKAEQLSKFVEGIFYENGAHEKITYQARDAGVWGDGIIHVYRGDNDRVEYERVMPHELSVDLVESAVTSKPKQFHRIKVADRGVAAEMWGGDEHALKAIVDSAPANYQTIGGQGTAADLITLVESWHLRSGPNATDGLHVISLPDSGKVLFREPYEKDYYPFVILPYTKDLIGFWGQGVCERVQSLQGELNRLMILDQKSRWMQASFKILVENTSKVVSQHLNNEVGAIIRYTGTPPQYITPPAIDNSNAQKIESLKQDGYQQEGVSQLNASNLKPSGLNSGAALRTFDTIAEDRQLFFGQRVESAALELARQSIEVVKDIHKEKGHYEVRFPNTNFVESIDWKDINLSLDEYWLKAFPTSELPEEPAAKLQTVQEYAQAGFISPRAARRLLSMPDVEMADKLANAAEELICKSIEEIIYDGHMVRPDSEWDLQLAKSLALQYMNYAKLNDCPPANLRKLRKFMSYIDDETGIIAQGQQDAAMAQQLQAMQQQAATTPIAKPAQPPVSDMQPFKAAS